MGVYIFLNIFPASPYFKAKDDPAALFAKGEAIVDLFSEQFIDRKFPFDPIDYIPRGKTKIQPAAEIRLSAPAINVVTGEKMDGVDLLCIVDAIGMHDEFGLCIVDWKTGARAYSQTKVEKGIQLVHNSLTFRIALDMYPGMFPALEIINKKKEDEIVYLLFKKTKVPIVEEPYHTSVSDANIDFFWKSLENFVKAIRNNIFPYCEGMQCDSMCSYKPMCDAIQNGKDPDIAYAAYMDMVKRVQKEKLNYAK